jgi:hypothetical protein
MKKPSLPAALGMKPKDEEGDDEDQSHDEAHIDAMDSFIDAVHAKDKEAALDAFKTLYDLCESTETEEEPDEEE